MAQAKAYVEGGADILSGKKDAVLGAVTGDRALETQGESQSGSSNGPWVMADYLMDLCR